MLHILNSLCPGILLIVSITHALFLFYKGHQLSLKLWASTSQLWKLLISILHLRVRTAVASSKRTAETQVFLSYEMVVQSVCFNHAMHAFLLSHLSFVLCSGSWSESFWAAEKCHTVHSGCWAVYQLSPSHSSCSIRLLSTQKQHAGTTQLMHTSEGIKKCPKTMASHSVRQKQK